MRANRCEGEAQDRRGCKQDTGAGLIVVHAASPRLEPGLQLQSVVGTFHMVGWFEFHEVPFPHVAAHVLRLRKTVSEQQFTIQGGFDASTFLTSSKRDGLHSGHAGYRRQTSLAGP